MKSLKRVWAAAQRSPAFPTYPRHSMRISAARACASSPSARAKTAISSASSASAYLVKYVYCVFLIKSSTLNGLEKRAVPDVGSV